MIGLIGLNGAGKSTTINEIIGLLRPYAGEIRIDGLTLATSPSAYRQKIGYIPETPSLYEELTLREHIETVAMAYDLDQEAVFARVTPLLKQFRLEEKLDWFPVHFSKGMKQKVMIICAFAVDPSLFIVDEPFLGLDPVAISDLIQLLNAEKEKGKSINAINFAMPKGKRHLQDVFITTPHGLIKKNRTGIGATTLELNSPRNSIIVVPTRALAYEKAASSKIEGESDKYRVLYVGGDITGFVVPEISDYLMDSSIRYKKFIVVADSLPRLLRIIGKEHYKDYFLMIDEIDSYQYDCSYRPNMENVMDYYFQFPISHRCLVSATIGEFSNKDIVEEPIINVQI